MTEMGEMGAGNKGWWGQFALDRSQGQGFWIQLLWGLNISVALQL